MDLICKVFEIRYLFHDLNSLFDQFGFKYLNLGRQIRAIRIHSTLRSLIHKFNNFLHNYFESRLNPLIDFKLNIFVQFNEVVLETAAKGGKIWWVHELVFLMIL